MVASDSGMSVYPLTCDRSLIGSVGATSFVAAFIAVSISLLLGRTRAVRTGD